MTITVDRESCMGVLIFVSSKQRTAWFLAGSVLSLVLCHEQVLWLRAAKPGVGGFKKPSEVGDVGGEDVGQQKASHFSSGATAFVGKEC